jgi:aspartate/methionine/tyrosine aminotransferase
VISQLLEISIRLDFVKDYKAGLRSSEQCQRPLQTPPNMVKIEPFEVEQWMDRLETTPGVVNMAETCAASVSVDDLVRMCEDKDAPGPFCLSKKLNYGAIRGSETLRQCVAALFDRESDAEPLPTENVLITQGAIAANFLTLYTLVGPGDHVICVYPTYQQLYSVPESLGAEVSLWKLKEENAYVPDVSELEGLVKPNTKVRTSFSITAPSPTHTNPPPPQRLILNNPNNPTGSTIPTTTLTQIITIAKHHNLTILSDEVYAPLYHSLPASQTPPPPSILALGYAKTIATGSMSKAWALAGIRTGWIASRDRALIEAVAAARDYTAISVSQLDEQVAAYALSAAVARPLLARNMALARGNLGLLAAFVERHEGVCDWVRPTAGTTALVRFWWGGRGSGGVPVEDARFVMEVLGETGVLVMPASPCFGGGRDFKGFVRVGYACETEVLVEGLEKLGRYVEEHLVEGGGN